MMRLAIPRALIVGIAALFSLFHVVLAVYSLGAARDPGPVIVAIALYAVATTAALLPVGPPRMPIVLAAFCCGAVVVMCLIVSSELDPSRAGGNGFATWWVAASGTLLTIVATRSRYGFAWAGTAFLVVHTVAWAGVPALVGLGVVGSVSWVAAAQAIGRGMSSATRDSQRFAVAEREATNWKALQQAHVQERQLRLGRTNVMAFAMLRTIEESAGNLTDEQRQECLYLESAIRDEIRGRSLLNDAVRLEVMAARRRGVTVTLLDEGGIDDLVGSELQRVLNRLADALRESTADRIVVRTVIEGAAAVSVVGLRLAPAADGSDGNAFEHGADDDAEIELWLEIPRRE